MKPIIYADPESNVMKGERLQPRALAFWKETTEYDPHHKQADTHYDNLDKPFATKRNSKAWHELIKELDTLKSKPVVGVSLPTESPHLSKCSGGA